MLLDQRYSNFEHSDFVHYFVAIRVGHAKISRKNIVEKNNVANTSRIAHLYIADVLYGSLSEA